MIKLKNNPAGNFFLLAGPVSLKVKIWQCALPNVW